MTPAKSLRDEVALVFAADEGFARPLAVAMHSALEHLAPGFKPEIYVLNNGLTEATRDRLRRSALRVAEREIRWIEVPSERLVAHRGAAHMTSTTYSRLLVPELLPKHITRAVYLDGDVLVTDDLAPLFDMSLANAPFAAVRDFAIATTTHEWSGVREPAVSRTYFNAGVLVIDTTLWRASGLAERALTYAGAGAEPLFFADQDAMNAVADEWCELEFRWNVQTMVFQLEEMPRTELTDRLICERDDLYRDAAVLHFTGFHKPWNPWATTRGTTLWARALMRSGWHTPTTYLSWVVPWLTKRAGINGARWAARYAPPGVGDAGRRAAAWIRGRSARGS